MAAGDIRVRRLGKALQEIVNRVNNERWPDGCAFEVRHIAEEALIADMRKDD